MNVSLGWLGDWVELGDLEPGRVADLLSLHTAEVEELRIYGEGIRDVVVGEVVECGPHPNADRLSLTRVEYGAGEAAPVVCGADNVRKGLKVAFAPVGTRLPGDLKIKKARLRGETSAGMICSERELELSDEHAGILELPEDAPVGRPFVEACALLDHVLELDNKSLTHRPDLWGHYGFARELAAILDRPLRPLDCAVEWPGQPTDWEVELVDSGGCPAYRAVEVDLGGAPRPAPAALRQRLLAVGQRPVNDVVDLSNAVLLEIGQPLHAFDAARLEGRRIVVRRAEAGERFTTLDHVERALDAEDLVIATPAAPVALAGVMGGADSEVGADTGRILLESAVFDAARVRRAAQRHALRTEASARFEKSLDPAYAEQAQARFCRRLLEIRPEARILGAPVQAGAAPDPELSIRLDPARAARLLGLGLDREEVAAPLRRLGFGVEDGGHGEFAVRVPSWRATKDVTIPEDLVEEVGRLHGYDRIAPAALHAPVTPPPAQPHRALTRRLVARLRSAHEACETQSHTFLERAWAERLGQPLTRFVPVANPVQAGADRVRRDPMPSLLGQAEGNVREHERGRLCEDAKGYEPSPGPEPRERRWIGLVEWARHPVPREGAESVFGRLRTVAEDLLASAGLAARAEPGCDPGLAPWAHPVHGLSWQAGGQLLGWSARVHPRLAAGLDFDRVDAGGLLFDVDALLEAGAGRPVAFRPPSRFPAIKLDVALAMPQELPYARVEAALRKAGGSVLEELRLFDVFAGESVGAGQRSLAFRVVLRAPDRTLGDEDEQKFLERVRKAAEALGGSLRG